MLVGKQETKLSVENYIATEFRCPIKSILFCAPRGNVSSRFLPVGHAWPLSSPNKENTICQQRAKTRKAISQTVHLPCFPQLLDDMKTSNQPIHNDMPTMAPKFPLSRRPLQPRSVNASASSLGAKSAKVRSRGLRL